VRRKRTKHRKDSDDESSSDLEPRAKKRNRIKKEALSSDNEEVKKEFFISLKVLLFSRCFNPQNLFSQKDSPSKGRHNIRKIIKDKVKIFVE